MSDGDMTSPDWLGLWPFVFARLALFVSRAPCWTRPKITDEFSYLIDFCYNLETVEDRILAEAMLSLIKIQIYT